MPRAGSGCGHLGRVAALLAGAWIVAACARGGEQAPRLRPGGDRDAHGCIGSAGYRWCAAQNACVRPWRVASSTAEFDARCADARRDAVD